MPQNEDILAVAASGNWVAVATSSNFLRVFSYAGTQKQIISLPGPVVCMSGYEQKLLVVCHAGIGQLRNFFYCIYKTVILYSLIQLKVVKHLIFFFVGLHECQNLGFIIYQICNNYVKVDVHFQTLPLSPKSTLKWLGFSDEGTPCSYDSAGILQALGHDYKHWMVLCDTKNQRKSTSDNYFIVGLSETNQNIRCIFCRNSHYPLLINNPTVIEIPLKMPVCEMEDVKSTNEEIFWRLMFSTHTMRKISLEKNELFKKFELPMNQVVLQLFAVIIIHFLYIYF